MTDWITATQRWCCHHQMPDDSSPGGRRGHSWGTAGCPALARVRWDPSLTCTGTIIDDQGPGGLTILLGIFSFLKPEQTEVLGGPYLKLLSGSDKLCTLSSVGVLRREAVGLEVGGVGELLASTSFHLEKSWGQWQMFEQHFSYKTLFMKSHNFLDEGTEPQKGHCTSSKDCWVVAELGPQPEPSTCNFHVLSAKIEKSLKPGKKKTQC